jgi:hypothetical protein
MSEKEEKPVSRIMTISEVRQLIKDEQQTKSARVVEVEKEPQRKIQDYFEEKGKFGG